MPPQDRSINGQTTPNRARSENLTRPSEIATEWMGEHADWRRMVIFSDHREAVASAVITLYRAALASADTALGEAPLYLRRMQNSIVLYFCPEAAKLCQSIFDTFGSDPTERPRNLQAYALITAD
jgi:hypothetical protein